jgi:penicillin-binding protein 1A
MISEEAEARIAFYRGLSPRPFSIAAGQPLAGRSGYRVEQLGHRIVLIARAPSCA